MTAPQDNGNLCLRPQRDIRIDLVRGLALFIIFLDHNGFLNPNFYWLNSLTLKRYSFIDAADVFFFISGYVSGMVYTRVLVTKGFVACIRKALKRSVELYLAGAIMFFFCSALILTAPSYDTNAPWTTFHRLSDLPSEAMRGTLTLSDPPSLFGLLPIYMVFVGLTPFAVRLCSYRPAILVSLSAGLYVTAQLLPHPFIYSDLNPLAWQVLFAAGVLLGFRRIHNLGDGQYLRPRALLIATTGLLFIAFLRLSPSPTLATLIHTRFLSQIVPDVMPLSGKQNVELLRIVNLSLWVLVVKSIDPARRFLRHWILRIPVTCGRQSLVVFCSSVFLNFVVRIYLRNVDGKGSQLAWNLFGCLVLFAIALVWSFMKSWFNNISYLSNWRAKSRRSLAFGFQYLAMLFYAVWQQVQQFLNNGMDA
ncbi:MAG TPA: OpgC domain-containing protein [Terriglobales bacterium]|nr:OpgC domain-containing protein [Terriglobales bacterium]